MRTKTFIVSFLFNPIWDCRPLYLLGNIQEGKVRKNLGTSTFFLEERAGQWGDHSEGRPTTPNRWGARGRVGYRGARFCCRCL